MVVLNQFVFALVNCNENGLLIVLGSGEYLFGGGGDGGVSADQHAHLAVLAFDSQGDGQYVN